MIGAPRFAPKHPAEGSSHGFASFDSCVSHVPRFMFLSHRFLVAENISASCMLHFPSEMGGELAWERCLIGEKIQAEAPCLPQRTLPFSHYGTSFYSGFASL